MTPMSTKEKEQLEGKRKVALETLSDPSLLNIVSEFYLENIRDEGEANRDAVDKYLYQPALYNQGPYTGQLIGKNLIESRQNGKRGTGTLSETQLQNNAREVWESALPLVKVEDIYKLIGSEVDLGKKGLKGKYMFELASSESPEDQELYSKIVNEYVAYVIDAQVSTARAASAQVGRKANLEKLVTEQEGEQ